MKNVIFNTPDHKVVFFEELTPASAVQANQVLIIHKGEGMLLDPGGHKVFSSSFQTSRSTYHPTR